LEPRDDRRERRLVREVGERRPPPEEKRLGKGVGGPCGIVPLERLRSLVREPLEPLEVERALGDMDDVTAAAGLDRIPPERLAEPRDVPLDQVRGGRRRVVAPEGVHQPRRGDDGARLAEEERERRALLRPTEPCLAPVDVRLERAEKAVADLHPATLLRCSAGAARLRWRHVPAARAHPDPLARPAAPSPVGGASERTYSRRAPHTAGSSPPSRGEIRCRCPFTATAPTPPSTWPTGRGRTPSSTARRRGARPTCATGTRRSSTRWTSRASGASSTCSYGSG